MAAAPAASDAGPAAKKTKTKAQTEGRLSNSFGPSQLPTKSSIPRPSRFSNRDPELSESAAAARFATGSNSTKVKARSYKSPPAATQPYAMADAVTTTTDVPHFATIGGQLVDLTLPAHNPPPPADLADSDSNSTPQRQQSPSPTSSEMAPSIAISVFTARAPITTTATATIFTAPGGLEQQTLRAYERGIPNARGDMVYFRPRFIVDDPWEALRGRRTVPPG